MREALLAYRAAHELNEEQLAERIGCQVSYLHRLLNGHSRMTLFFAQRVGDALPELREEVQRFIVDEYLPQRWATMDAARQRTDKKEPVPAA